MSNNSWKQYGGTSKIDSLNTISVGTVIADQFVSRSVRPTYQFYNGTIQVSLNVMADTDIISGNSIYTKKDLFVKKDSYINNKLYFGNNINYPPDVSFTMPTALPLDNSCAYMHGTYQNIGVNTMSPNTAFHITGVIAEVTDILTV